jgi:hypothetical protein
VQIDISFCQRARNKLAQMETNRQPYFEFWQELANFYLPRRYVWLADNTASRVRSMRNPHILDSTGTIAARVLASGMMNGITSPARPWFSLRIAGYDDALSSSPVRIWLDEVTKRMMLVLAESNFYNALAVMYLDLVVFGTAAMLVYEDFESVIRCYNPALGEYYIAQDDRLAVNTFARKFTYNVDQIVSRWGEDNVTVATKALWKLGGASTQMPREVYHLIEPNDDGKGAVPKRFRFRETYWEKDAPLGLVLEQRGFNELPGLFPRWELAANDAYGSCPAMESIGDVKQLQQETLRKAQGIDKVVNPPLVADIQLQHRPTATVPGGVTYVAGVNNIGAKPLYQIAPPLGEMTQDIIQIQQRIRETFHNPLFQMISNLDTVRSATEIDARKEEKLVLLGPVLERFENEALDPAINRVFAIMTRMGLLPEAPEEISEADIEIQYVSILSTAQRAVSAIPTERWMAFIGNLSAVKPDILNIPNFEEVIRTYGSDLGVPAKLMNPPAVSQAATQAQNQQAQDAAAIEQSAALTGAAQQLSATEVGGGQNAIQALLGG